MKMLKLKYIPTGNVFELPEEDAREIKNNDRGNFVILGEELEEAVNREQTTFDKVVVEGTGVDETSQENSSIQDENKDVSVAETASFEDMTVPNLKEYCKSHNISVKNLDKKADIIAKINASLICEENQ